MKLHNCYQMVPAFQDITIWFGLAFERVANIICQVITQGLRFITLVCCTAIPTFNEVPACFGYFLRVIEPTPDIRVQLIHIGPPKIQEKPARMVAVPSI